MKNINQKSKNHLVHLCKNSGCKNERTTLYFCQSCRETHNARTRELKRKYRHQGQCVMCGNDSNNKRRCKACSILNKKYVENSLYLQSKKSKTGVYGTMKEIMEII